MSEVRPSFSTFTTRCIFLPAGLSSFIALKWAICYVTQGCVCYKKCANAFSKTDGGSDKEPGGEGWLCSFSLYLDDQQEDLLTDCYAHWRYSWSQKGQSCPCFHWSAWASRHCSQPRPCQSIVKRPRGPLVNNVVLVNQPFEHIFCILCVKSKKLWILIFH